MSGLKYAAVVMALVFIGAIGFSAPVSAADKVIGCVVCHTDAEKLKELTRNLSPDQPKGPGRGQGLPLQERWEKVLVDKAFLEDENHGTLGCTECHHGNPDNLNYEIAHKGVVLEPSYPGPGVCDNCHDQSKHYKTSLHYSLRGMKAPLMERADDSATVHKAIDGAFNNCSRCHASCGQCHVSRPVHVSGGLLKGHLFQKSPQMELTCAGCHDSTVQEFKGGFKDVKPDLHFADLDMSCMDCHKAEQMHGDGKEYPNRYAVEDGPKCMDCHDGIYEEGADNKGTHTLHRGRVSCQVCHSQAYANCSACHLEKSWSEGKYKFEMAFKIGRNPLADDRHPEKFVTVREAPITRDMFDPYVKDALTNFDKLPTWRMATPHNIQRATKQNSDCNNCHGFTNKELFLLRTDISRENRNANRGVTVPPRMIPAPIKK